MYAARLASAAVSASLVAMAALPAAAGAGGNVVLAPHRAVYEISLERTTPGSGVADMSGRLVYEITGSACEGFTQSMRFVTRTTNQEGETSVTDLRTSSWEDTAAHRLRFSTNTYQNEQLAEQTKGDARRAASSDATTVALDKPAKKSVDVAAGVYFPIQHSMALIEAARSGKSMFTADLFDGSDNGEKVYATSAAIGRRAAPGAIAMPALAEGGDKLSRVPSWPVSISYYEKDKIKGDAVPAYEMSYRFHDNGVTSKLLIDHGEFAFKGELTDLKFLESAECSAGKP